MKTFWQIGRATLLRALRAIALPAMFTLRSEQTNGPRLIQHWRSIGTAALLACAFLLPAFAAQAQVQTVLSLSSSQNPSTVGNTVIITATITPQAASANTPTGTVSFTDLSNFSTIGTVNVTTGPNGTGLAPLSISNFTAGTHPIIASYQSGDGNFSNSSTINALNQQVLAAGVTGTTTTLTSSQNPSEVGQSVTFTATVAADSGNTTPTGNVSFQDNGTQIGANSLTNGVATFSTNTLTAGSHNITAAYNFDNGNTSFATSTSNLIQQNVTNGIPTVVAVTGSPNPSTANQQVTFTATVSVAAGFTGSPTGSVDFRDVTTNTDLGTANLQNVGGTSTASVSASFTQVETHNITATYTSNSATFETGTTGSTSQIVTSGIATTATLTSSRNPSLAGQSVTFTVKITAANGGTPTGQVTFQDTATGGGFQNTVALVAAPGGGAQATLTTTNLVAGTNSISVIYNGDGTFAASTASLTQTVNTPVATSTTVTSAAFERCVWFRS
jgi:large repetitive protein